MHQLKEPYLSKSSTNGRYVGRTVKKNPEIRWMKGKGYLYYSKTGELLKHQYSFGRAILKYGWDNFDHVILEEVDNANVDQAERYWINKMESFSKGYNESLGGGGSLSFRHTVATKQKLSKLATVRVAEPGYVNPNKGNVWTEEMRAKASIRTKEYFKEHPEKLKELSAIKKLHYANHPETREKISMARKGKKLSDQEKERLKREAKKYFSDPKNRKIHGEAVSRFYIEHPEARVKRSEYMTGRKMPKSGRVKQSEKQKRKVLHIDDSGEKTIYPSRKEASSALGFSNVARWYVTALKTGEKIDGKKMRSDSGGKKFDGHTFKYLNESSKYGGESYMKGGAK